MRPTPYVRSILTTLFLLGLLAPSKAQVIWSEDFNSYSNGTDIGGNNNTANPSADWTAVCPGSAAATDYFDVRNGLLEGRDTNGPATWESESIDISGCSAGVEVTVDLSEVGTLEGCNNCGNSCNCTDWILLATSVDGGLFTRYTSAAGGNCTRNGCTDGNYVTLDDFNAFTFNTGCLYGNTLAIRIEVQSWAGTEYLRIDNVAVTCNAAACALLPVSLDQWEVQAVGPKVRLDWTVDPALLPTFFELERSTDGIHFEALEQVATVPHTNSYQTWDPAPLPGTSYYRLGWLDDDGTMAYASIRALTRPTTTLPFQLYPNPVRDDLTIQWTAETAPPSHLILYDWGGRPVLEQYNTAPTTTLSLGTLPAGTYVLRLASGEQTWYRRIVVQH